MNRAKTKCFLLSLAVGLSSFAGAEFLARSIEVSTVDSERYRFHSQLGWTAKPSVHTTVKVGADEVPFATSPEGFRQTTTPAMSSTEKSASHQGTGAGTRNFLLLGDSFTEAVEVPAELTYWGMIERHLREHSDPSWRAINRAVADYGTTQQLIALRRLRRDLEPEFVVLQTFAMNDVLNNSRLAANIASNQDAYRPYLNERTTQTTHLSPTNHFLRHRSYLARLALSALSQRQITWSRERFFDTIDERRRYATRTCQAHFPACKDGFLWLMSNTLAPEDHQLEFVREGWRNTDRAIQAIAEECAHREIPLIVVNIPFYTQLASQRKRTSYPYPIEVRYAERRISRLPLAGEVRVVNLIDVFDRNNQAVTPYVNGHLGKSAHDVVAREILDALGSLLSQ